MQFKASFVMTAVGQLLTSFSAFLAIWFLFMRFSSIGGFSFSEVMICYSVSLFSFSSAECLVRGFDAFPSTVRDGSFDRIMVRPRSTVLQVLGSKIELSRVGRFAQGLIILIYAIVTCGVEWNLPKALTLAFMIIGGFAVFSGLFMIYAALCFFTLDGLEFMNIFTDGGRELCYYPLSVYGKGLLTFFTYVIPFACVQYYPFLYITGRSDAFPAILLPAAGILFLVPSYLIWQFGVRRYQSNGS